MSGLSIEDITALFSTFDLSDSEIATCKVQLAKFVGSHPADEKSSSPNKQDHVLSEAISLQADFFSKSKNAIPALAHHLTAYGLMATDTKDEEQTKAKLKKAIHHFKKAKKRYKNLCDKVNALQMELLIAHVRIGRIDICRQLKQYDGMFTRVIRAYRQLSGIYYDNCNKSADQAQYNAKLKEYRKCVLSIYNRHCDYFQITKKSIKDWRQSSTKAKNWMRDILIDLESAFDFFIRSLQREWDANLAYWLAPKLTSVGVFYQQVGEPIRAEIKEYLGKINTLFANNRELPTLGSLPYYQDMQQLLGNVVANNANAYLYTAGFAATSGKASPPKSPSTQSPGSSADNSSGSSPSDNTPKGSPPKDRVVAQPFKPY